MKHYLTLIAATKNNNQGDDAAETRISEIYSLLKQKNSLSESEAAVLVREALLLKKASLSITENFSSSPVQLFCFPYAGGSASLYDKWSFSFPPQIKVHPIEYPGRGRKSGEQLIPNLSNLLDNLEKEILLKITPGTPFAFFGHSLGALLAFELALRLKDKFLLEPVVLFLSGCPSPDSIHSLTLTSQLSDKEFIEAIQGLNGTPMALIHTDEFRNFFLPILRNDFSLLDAYNPSPKSTLTCPLTLFWGKNDSKVTLDETKKWHSWTQGQTICHAIDGDHFFLHQPTKILEKIEEFFCLIPS